MPSHPAYFDGSTRVDEIIAACDGNVAFVEAQLVSLAPPNGCTFTHKPFGEGAARQLVRFAFPPYPNQIVSAWFAAGRPIA